MVDWQQRVAMWALAAVVAYITYRWLFASKEQSQSGADYEQELQKILTSDKYKVKGRFED